MTSSRYFFACYVPLSFYSHHHTGAGQLYTVGLDALFEVLGKPVYKFLPLT